MSTIWLRQTLVYIIITSFEAGGNHSSQLEWAEMVLYSASLVKNDGVLARFIRIRCGCYGLCAAHTPPLPHSPRDSINLEIGDRSSRLFKTESFVPRQSAFLLRNLVLNDSKLILYCLVLSFCFVASFWKYMFNTHFINIRHEIKNQRRNEIFGFGSGPKRSCRLTYLLNIS